MYLASLINQTTASIKTGILTTARHFNRSKNIIRDAEGFPIIGPQEEHGWRFESGHQVTVESHLRHQRRLRRAQAVLVVFEAGAMDGEKLARGVVDGLVEVRVGSGVVACKELRGT